MKRKIVEKSSTPEAKHVMDVWVKILIPVLAISVFSLAAGIFIIQASVSQPPVAQQWAHISIIFMVLPLALIGFFILVLVLLFSYFTARLNRNVPPKLRGLRSNIELLSEIIQNKTVKPANFVIATRSLGYGFYKILHKHTSTRSKND